MTHNRIQKKYLETEEAKIINENQVTNSEFHQRLEQESFVSNKELKHFDNSINRIQILENRRITFEELLLMQVKAGAHVKVKRQKIASGAEVITHDDKRKMEERNKKEPQTKTNTTMVKK